MTSWLVSFNAAWQEASHRMGTKESYSDNNTTNGEIENMLQQKTPPSNDHQALVQEELQSIKLLFNDTEIDLSSFAPLLNHLKRLSMIRGAAPSVRNLSCFVLLPHLLFFLIV